MASPPLLTLTALFLAGVGHGLNLSESDFLKEFLRKAASQDPPINIIPPPYNGNEDLSYLKKIILQKAFNLRKEKPKVAISHLTTQFVNHEIAHLQEYANKYGHGIEDQLSHDGRKKFGDVKQFFEEMMNTSNLTYDRFLDYLNSYVRESTHFWLFAKDIDRYEELVIGEKSNISQSKFNASRPTVIIIHGWVNAGDNFYSQNMIDAYKKHGDYNIISVDWSKLSYTFYTMSRISVNFIGPYVAQLIDHLIEKEGAKLDQFHILGHSLGAHVAGIAGKFVKSGKIGRITGFDPASPLFGDDEKFRLNSSDAKFVDVIHSSLLGMQEQLGHIDYYPNGGGPLQPGCGINIGVCPHRRAYEYFIESMEPNSVGFLAYPCSTWLAFQEGNCTSNPASLGVDFNTTISGKYFFRTAEGYPFALGTRTLEPLTSEEIKRPPTKKPPKKPNKIWEKFNFLPFIHK